MRKTVLTLISVIWLLIAPMAPAQDTLYVSNLGQTPTGNAAVATNTFTAPGNGADHLLNYPFTSDFAFGLASVKIDASRWAMDEFMFVIPEPGTVSLLVLGLLALGAWQLRHRGKSVH